MHPPLVSTVLAGLANRDCAAIDEWSRVRLGRRRAGVRPTPPSTGRARPANYVLQFGPDPDLVGAVTVLVAGSAR